MELLASAGDAVSLWPLAILGVAVAFVVIMIAVLRVHAFIALMLAALIVGMLSAPLPAVPRSGVSGHLARAVEWTMHEFGRTAGGIGFLIAMAAIIGVCLMESGAADKIVRRFMAVFGEKNAPLALLASGFFLSIPVFFDTVFFLLIPLARALGVRTGKNYLLYVLAICGGGALTHSLVPPTPGPLLVVEGLGLDLGQAMVAGLIAGIIPAVGVYFLARFMDSRIQIPLRETSGASLQEIQAAALTKEEDLPPFWLSVLPVVLPVVLVALGSFLAMAGKSLPGFVEAVGGRERFDTVFYWMEFLGNRNIALLAGAAVALILLVRHKGIGMPELGASLAKPLETAGVIILITGAGGAFGGMIGLSGIRPVIEHLAAGWGVSYIVLAWAFSAIIRAAQGSATVAMISGAGLMAAVIGDGSALPYHPLYIFLAIAFGSMILSWMNDSGFWVVCKLSGFTERETLKTWTVMITFLSVIGLVEVLILSSIFPLKSLM